MFLHTTAAEEVQTIRDILSNSGAVAHMSVQEQVRLLLFVNRLCDLSSSVHPFLCRLRTCSLEYREKRCITTDEFDPNSGVFWQAGMNFVAIEVKCRTEWNRHCDPCFASDHVKSRK